MPGSSGDGGSEPTFYEALGVGEDASAAAIRRAYRERAKDTHPDVSDAPDAARRFRRVKRAHDVLTDDRERRRYDRLGHEAYVGLDDPDPEAEGGATDPAGSRAARTTDPRGGTSSTRGTARRTPGGADNGTGRRTERGTTGSGRDRAGGRSSRRGRPGASGRGRQDGVGTATGAADDDPVGRAAYGLVRWLRLAGVLLDAWQSRLGPAGAAVALATFAAYPVLLASSVTPLFPLGVNLLVAFCTVCVLGYLVVRPAVGVAVLGTWLLVLPAALTVSGVGMLSFGGVYALVVTVVPLVLCVATLAGVVA
jgi:curved DNA-binding protein CbpA